MVGNEKESAAMEKEGGGVRAGDASRIRASWRKVEHVEEKKTQQSNQPPTAMPERKKKKKGRADERGQGKKSFVGRKRRGKLV